MSMGFAGRRNTRSGRPCCTISTIRFPRWSTTSLCSAARNCSSGSNDRLTVDTAMSWVRGPVVPFRRSPEIAIFVHRGDTVWLSLWRQYGHEPSFHSSVNFDLSEVWAPGNGDHAGRFLPVVLRVQGLRYPAKTEAGGLLCLLLLRHRALSLHPTTQFLLLSSLRHAALVDPSTVFGRKRPGCVVARRTLGAEGVAGSDQGL